MKVNRARIYETLKKSVIKHVEDEAQHGNAWQIPIHWRRHLEAAYMLVNEGELVDMGHGAFELAVKS